MKTIIDNIYNKINPEANTGNIATPIFDHLMQFPLEPSPFTSNCKQTTKTWYCYKSFNKEQFRNDLSRTDLEQGLELNKNDVNNSVNFFLNVINTTMNNQAPIKIKPKS